MRELLELCAAKCAIIPNMSTHYTIGQFSEIVGVCVKTLQRWDREGRLKALRTHTNRRYYNEEHLSQVLGEKKRSLPRKVVVYCRVSSRQQATHLKNQREAMEHFCLSAGYRVDEWIMEYGSGMNFKRKKFIGYTIAPLYTVLI